MKQEIIKSIESIKCRSAWSRGVNEYASMIIADIDEKEISSCLTYKDFKRLLFNGAGSWEQYSYGGCALIYDSDICKTLCNPSEIKRTDSGRLNPNSRESWLDVQTRALSQASNRLIKAWLKLNGNKQ